MYTFNALASLALLLSAHLVQASVYVTNPVQSTVCTGGQSCQVQWVDNGESPLLSDIGNCDVGLYTGELQLVQSLPSVNVATTNSFTFTPNPAAGPNGPYYIVFTASSINYMGFSGSFTLNGMTGTAPGGSSGAGGSSNSGSASATPTATSPSSPTGTSTPVGTAAPTQSTPAPGNPSPTVSTPPVSSPTPTTPTSVSPVSTTASGSTFSTTPSATPSNAAVRVGSSASLGSALFIALAGALVF